MPFEVLETGGENFEEVNLSDAPRLSHQTLAIEALP
jgi:hypothetical protein